MKTVDGDLIKLAEAGEFDSFATEPRQAIPELGEFDLQHALLGVGMLGEYVEYQGNAVHDIALERLLEVALLGGAEIVVEHDDIDVLDLRNGHQLAEFPATDERGSRRALALHQNRFNWF